MQTILLKFSGYFHPEIILSKIIVKLICIMRFVNK